MEERDRVRDRDLVTTMQGQKTKIGAQLKVLLLCSLAILTRNLDTGRDS